MRVTRLGDPRNHAVGVGGNGADGAVELGEGEAQRHRGASGIRGR